MSKQVSVIRNLWKIENFIIFFMVWFCILSLHSSFRRSEVYIPGDTVNDPVFNIRGRTYRVKGSHDLNQTKRDKSGKGLSDAELSKLVDEEIKLHKNSNTSKERDTKNRKAIQQGSEKVNYTTLVLKWFYQRPKRDKPSGVPDKSKYLPNYLINPRETMCGNSPIDLLLYFHSRPGDPEKRQRLRDTWAAMDIFKDLNVRRIFLLGQSDSRKEAENVYKEGNEHKDIIQGDFLDSYRNISLKALMMLDWVYHYCGQAKYIVKADDDMFVNPFLLIENFISKIWKQKRVVLCHLKDEQPVLKDKNSRWYIPLDLLINDILLPRHCSGYVAVMTGELIPELYLAAADQPFVPVDDVYLFGFLLSDVAYVKYLAIQEELTLNKDVGLAEYKDNKPGKHLAVSAWGNDAQHSLWNYTLKSLTPLGKQIINPKYLK